MNRRIAGRVKQARKRAQKRADIRAGRVISMQEYVNRTHAHNHTPVETDGLERADRDQVGTHELVAVYADNTDRIEVGTEYAMRKLRLAYLEKEPNAKYSVRKVK